MDAVSAEAARRHVADIAEFLGPLSWLWTCHVVDFFSKRQWEHVDATWLAALRSLPTEELLKVPSGLAMAQEEWPASLRHFVLRARQLSLPRTPAPSQEAVICSVTAQGMNPKKRHEISRLAALVASLAEKVGATHVVDFGAGQGYLAMVLAFRYGLRVLAIDNCAHHGTVTTARSQRVAKYYNNPRRAAESKEPAIQRVPPVAVTKHVDLRMPSSSFGDLLDDLDADLAPRGDSQRSDSSVLPERNTFAAARGERAEGSEGAEGAECKGERERADEAAEGKRKKKGSKKKRRVVLVGLHACGDLSAALLRAFVEWDDAAALVSVGCCYNLLTETPQEELTESFLQHGTEAHVIGRSGFPLSRSVREQRLHVGRTGRDLACQSAERWAAMDPEAARKNFEAHSYRGMLQLVLLRHFPEAAALSPAVGRLGKLTSRKKHGMKEELQAPASVEDGQGENFERLPETSSANAIGGDPKNSANFSSFTRYAEAALDRLNLNLNPLPSAALEGAWREGEPWTDLIGPFWTLRAVAAGPLESLLLLDRLLFLHEQFLRPERERESKQGEGEGEGEGEGKEAALEYHLQLIPIFDPAVSPRNVAVVAVRERVGGSREGV